MLLLILFLIALAIVAIALLLRRRNRTDLARLLVALFLPILITMAAGTVLLVAQREPTSSQPFAAIILPQDGQRVAREILVQGTVQSLRAGQQIWIAVVPDDTSLYYPQSGPVTIQGDGDWISPPVFLGSTDDIGQRGFDVLAIIAGSQAQQALNEYLERNQQKDQFPGLDELPQDTTVADSVTVIRQ
jgi:hypothetical protein